MSIHLTIHAYRRNGGIKVKFALEEAMKVQRESRGIPLLFL